MKKIVISLNFFYIHEKRAIAIITITIMTSICGVQNENKLKSSDVTC